MSEGVTLICKPICECGYIFDSLKNIVVEEQIGEYPILGRTGHYYASEKPRIKNHSYNEPKNTLRRV